MSSQTTVRDLTNDENPSIDDCLLVSDTDAGATKKATIKNIVKTYNSDLIKQANDPSNVRNGKGPLAEVTFDSDGNMIIGESDPITAGNIESLIDPGSGLEIIQECYNSAGVRVSCDGPDVAYIQKKIALATSESATLIKIRVNKDEGKQYSSDSIEDWKSVTGTTLNTKCERLRDAFAWVKGNVSSTSIHVQIIIETDTEEGTCSQGTFKMSRKIGQVDIWDVGLHDATYALTRNKINIDAVTDSNSTIPFWVDHGRIAIFGVHFIFNVTSSGVHKIMRFENINADMLSCKVTVNSTHKVDGVIEVISGCKLHIRGHSRSGLAYSKDPHSVGIDEVALELDLGGMDVKCPSVFNARRGSRFEIIEYAPWNFNPPTHTTNTIHFTSDASFDNLIDIRESSQFESNTTFTRNSSATISIDRTFYAFGFNSIIVSDHKNDIGTDITPNYPGTIKFHANSEEKVDYRLGGSFYNKNSLPTRQDYR
tara:strand:- start:255 stop:1700 length:1446 start_codon:yes stop_codon:yes gene_type:complete